MSVKKEITQLDELKFIHITDTHLLNHPEELLNNVNTKKSFERIIKNSQLQYPDVDFYIITGDISQTGSKESYEILRSILLRCNAPIYCVPGNHDTPMYLQEVVLTCPTDSINVIEFDNHVLILMSSYVKNYHYGEISQQSLQQLEKYIKKNYKKFIIIAIHHPPVLLGSKWLNEVDLKNKSELLQIINQVNQDIVLISGHIHQELDQTIKNLRIFSTPSTCYQFKPDTDYMQCIHTPPPAYRFMQINELGIIKTKVHYLE